MTRLLTCLVLLAAVACDSGPESPVPPDPEELPKPRVVAAGDYVTTTTGLKYYDFKVGAGDSVRNGNIVQVHYHGWLTDSTLFDTSYLRQEPYLFRVGAGSVIPGWDEGVLNMQVGGERQLVIPPELAYGDRGRGPVPPNATLIFELLLVELD